MALVVFLRGVNVGGHRSFRPSLVAKALSRFDVVNIGAAGTFVVRKPGTQARFREALLAKLPFEAHVALCDGRDVLALVREHTFGPEPPRPGITRFVSVLSKSSRLRPTLPATLPPTGEWFVRVVGSTRRFVFGEYKRHMKTITWLGKIDHLFGVPVTTRNWRTIEEIVRVLQSSKANAIGERPRSRAVSA